MSGIPYDTIVPDPAPAPVEPVASEIGTEAEVKLAPGLYYGIALGTLVIYFLLLVLGIYFFTKTFVWEGAPVGLLRTWNIGLPMLLLLGVHIAKSLQYVKLTEFGGIEFYGQPLMEVLSGLKFVPWGLFQLNTLPRNTLQEQFPGEPESVFKGHDTDPVGTYTRADGKEMPKVRPIRVNTRPATDAEIKDLGIEKNDPLATQTVIGLSFFVRFRIKCFFQFAIRIGGTDEAKRQMRDTGEKVLSEDLSARSTAGAIIRLTEINNRLRSEVEKLTKSWGVEIVEVGLLAPDISREIAEALRNIPTRRANAVAEAYAVRTAAEATRDQKIEIGKGDRQRLISEGEGAAVAAQALLVAEAKGRKQMVDDLKVAGQDVLASETAKNLAKAGTIILGTEGFAQAFGLVEGIKSKLSGSTESKDSGPKDSK